MIEHIRINPTAPHGTIVFLHGFGSDAANASGIAYAIDPEQNFQWLFLQAPSILPDFSGRYWFPNDPALLAQALSENYDYFRQIEEVPSPGIAESADMILEAIEEEGLAWDRLVLGGHSQGAMMTTQVIVHRLMQIESADPPPPLPAGILVCSGALVNKAQWYPVFQRVTPKQRCPVLQLHGEDDDVLSFTTARHVEALYKSAGFPIRFVPFIGGHMIDQPQFVIIRDTLHQWLISA